MSGVGVLCAGWTVGIHIVIVTGVKAWSKHRFLPATHTLDTLWWTAVCLQYVQRICSRKPGYITYTVKSTSCHLILGNPKETLWAIGLVV